MALNDDLNRLAQDAVVYLTQQYSTPGSIMAADGGQNNPPTVVYRGRLRQSLSGDWVFNTSVGTNGVAAIVLSTGTGSWYSNETPAGGIQVTASWMLMAGTGGPLVLNGAPVVDGSNGQEVQIGTLLETITLSDVIPSDLVD